MELAAVKHKPNESRVICDKLFSGKGVFLRNLPNRMSESIFYRF